MLKRKYYPINKEAIKRAIDAYNEFCERSSKVTKEEEQALWNKYCDIYDKEICPGSYLWASSIFQPMKFAETLTVDNVYNTIIASGINTKLEDDYE